MSQSDTILRVNSNWLDIETQFYSNILQLCTRIPGWNLSPPMTQLLRPKWLKFLSQNDSTFWVKMTQLFRSKWLQFFLSVLPLLITFCYYSAALWHCICRVSLSLFRKGFWEKSKVQCISKALLIGLQDASLMVQSAVKWVEPETAQRSARLLRQASGCANGSARKGTTRGMAARKP